MSEATQEIIGLMLLVAFIVFVVISIAKEQYDSGYRRGQADALSGVRNCRLVEFKDGERKWYKESELKDLVEHTIII